MIRPFTRSLHPDDYGFLPHAGALRAFEAEMTREGVGHRAWCEHRLWEYASMMQQLEQLGVPHDARIIDVGSGGSFFPPYLATVGGYPNVVITDSMAYGDITADIESQRAYYGIPLPLYDMLIEDMSAFAADTFDVVMCISSIEHVAADQHDNAFREICRITKPGGFIFITTDYFRDLAQWHASPSKFMQHTPYTKEFVLTLPSLAPVEFVGETDLDYRGDFVHNHSFANICLRKVA